MQLSGDIDEPCGDERHRRCPTLPVQRSQRVPCAAVREQAHWCVCVLGRSSQQLQDQLQEVLARVDELSIEKVR